MTTWMAGRMHFAEPYPTPEERRALAAAGGITDKQVYPSPPPTHTHTTTHPPRLACGVAYRLTCVCLDLAYGVRGARRFARRPRFAAAPQVQNWFSNTRKRTWKACAAGAACTGRSRARGASIVLAQAMHVAAGNEAPGPGRRSKKQASRPPAMARRRR